MLITGIGWDDLPQELGFGWVAVIVTRQRGVLVQPASASPGSRPLACGAPRPV